MTKPQQKHTDISASANSRSELPKGKLTTTGNDETSQRNDPGRIPIKTLAVTESETEASQAREALRQKAEELETLMDAIPAAVWISRDPECLSITGNRKANAFYEAEAGENVSASTNPEPRKFYAPDGRELSADELPMQRAVSNNRDVNDFELHVKAPSGRRRAMLGSAIPLRQANGQVRRVS